MRSYRNKGTHRHRNRKHRGGASSSGSSSLSSGSSSSSSRAVGGRRRNNVILFGGSPAVTNTTVTPTQTHVTTTTVPVAPTVHAATTTTHPVAATVTQATSAVTTAMKGGKRRRQKGGNWQWAQQNFGTLDQQWNNTFGPESITQQGNLLTTMPGAPAVVPGTFPPGSLHSQSQSGGKTRKRKRGGIWGQVIEKALVPFGLVALQNNYSKRMRTRSRK